MKLGEHQTSWRKYKSTLRVMTLDLEVEKHKLLTSGGRQVEDVLEELVNELEILKLELAMEKKKTGNTTSTVISDMLKDPASPGYRMLRQSVMISAKSNL